MKINCRKCGNRLKSEICKQCGYDNSIYYRTEKYSRRSLRELIAPWLLVTVIVGAFLALCVSCTVCPEVWSVSAKENRAAILEYANINYPEAKIVAENYPSAEFNPTGNPYDVIWFEFDGIKFFVQARNGKVNEKDDDGYGAAVIQKEIREKYLDNFFLPRGLTYNAQINFSKYWPQRNDILSTYKGYICLEFELDYDGNKKSPQDYGWFYDFYCYWRDECPTQKFTLRFYYLTDSQTKYMIYCDSASELNDKDKFYDSAERISI